MQEAVNWIRGSSTGNNQAMDKYMAGATASLNFHSLPVRGDWLAHFMRGNTQVISLYLNRWETTQEGLVSLLDALQSNRAIERLSVYHLHLVGQNMAAVANLVKHNGSIDHLSLMGCEIDGNGVALLCEALGQNDYLRKDLNLSENLIGSRGAEALGRYLMTNPALASLDLSESLETGDDLAALVSGLKENTNLKCLVLHDCSLGDREAVIVADVLRHNTGLKELDLSSNSIGVSGQVALAKALRVNRSLQKLWFGSYDKEELDEDVKDAFVDMLCLNVCITDLGRDPDEIGYEIESNPSLEPLLRRNRERIPAAVRRAALLLIGVCRFSTNYEGMGDFAIVPKDVVKLIAMEVWATRTDPIWMWAL